MKGQAVQTHHVDSALGLVCSCTLNSGLGLVQDRGHMCAHPIRTYYYLHISSTGLPSHWNEFMMFDLTNPKLLGANTHT